MSHSKTAMLFMTVNWMSVQCDINSLFIILKTLRLTFWRCCKKKLKGTVLIFITDAMLRQRWAFLSLFWLICMKTETAEHGSGKVGRWQKLPQANHAYS